MLPDVPSNSEAKMTYTGDTMDIIFPRSPKQFPHKQHLSILKVPVSVWNGVKQLDNLSGSNRQLVFMEQFNSLTILYCLDMCTTEKFVQFSYGQICYVTNFVLLIRFWNQFSLISFCLLISNEFQKLLEFGSKNDRPI